MRAIALVLAAGSLVGLELWERSRLAQIAEVEIERMKQLGQIVVDSTFTDQERAICEGTPSLEALAEQIRDEVGTLRALWFCQSNPADSRCVSMRIRERCDSQQWFSDVRASIKDNAVWDAIVNAPGALFDAVLAPFGDLAWLLLAGGLVYVVVLK